MTRQAKSIRSIRARLRAAGRCVVCRKPSKTYRHKECRWRKASSDAFSIRPELLHILRHSIGLDDHGKGRDRNHFTTDPEGPDGQMCQELCAAGWMKDHGAQSMWGGMHCYCVTEQGKAVVRLHKPLEKRLTAAQRRYQDFLDADSGLPFGEWLKARRGC